MLTRVLEAQRYPQVDVHVERTGAGKLHVSIQLHGVTRRVDMPANVLVADGLLTVTGAFTLRQTDFGITPMSVGGGLLAVDDVMELRFRIVARRWTG
jgi:polyisoprenoid-binding protein YceI